MSKPPKSTRRKIEPALRETYGKGAMVAALTDHLAKRIDAEDWDSRGREHMIYMVCWDWFSGGSTAEVVARRIEESLGAAA